MRIYLKNMVRKIKVSFILDTLEQTNFGSLCKSMSSFPIKLKIKISWLDSFSISEEKIVYYLRMCPVASPKQASVWDPSYK